MDARLARRLAADLMGVGESRVWIDPDHLDEVAMAISRQEIRALIKDGTIQKHFPSTPSRGRARIRRLKRKKGRGRGPGSRKGPRFDEKRIWIAHVRAQRRFIRYLRDKGLIDRSTYRKLYRLIKGGAFRNLSHLKLYLKERGLVKGEQ